MHDKMFFKEYCCSGPFFGRPKCEIKITAPPFPKIYLIVGKAALIRLSSSTLNVNLSNGTLKSTRIIAFFPLKL